MPLYVNRKYFVEFLFDRVFQQKHSNILEDFLYVTFSSLQYVAMTRANAIVDLLISRPLRWLSGNKQHSPLSTQHTSLNNCCSRRQVFTIAAMVAEVHGQGVGFGGAISGARSAQW